MSGRVNACVSLICERGFLLSGGFVLMRFHKAEVAFFIFISMLLAALAFQVQAYRLIEPDGPLISRIPNMLRSVSFFRDASFHQLAIGSAVSLTVTVLFGACFLYPLIRRQGKEENKLRALTQSLSVRSDTLEHEALTDSLTGMQNRRYFDGALEEYLQEFGRIGKPVGLMVLDLDFFKRINDTHGHDAGDEVLRVVARCLRDCTRYHDVVARVGGEEFGIIAPNVDASLLAILAERIRKAIAKLNIETGNIHLKVTTSVGLVIWDGRESAVEFYRRADQLLYEAKRGGRNRVVA